MKSAQWQTPHIVTAWCHPPGSDKPTNPLSIGQPSAWAAGLRRRQEYLGSAGKDFVFNPPGQLAGRRRRQTLSLYCLNLQRYYPLTVIRQRAGRAGGKRRLQRQLSWKHSLFRALKKTSLLLSSFFWLLCCTLVSSISSNTALDTHFYVQVQVHIQTSTSNGGNLSLRRGMLLTFCNTLRCSRFETHFTHFTAERRYDGWRVVFIQRIRCPLQEAPTETEEACDNEDRNLCAKNTRAGPHMVVCVSRIANTSS
jgi:hypothetical protein